MKPKEHKIKISELFAGYVDSGDAGVVAYGGKLDVRPAYQREFVYPKEKRDAVIETLLQGCPIGIMYWGVKADGNYELLDGQQRTISICQWLAHDYAIEFDGRVLYEDSSNELKSIVLDTELLVYFCDGTDEEKLNWFERINTGGLELMPQELNNAIYTGPWLYEAKKSFSKAGCRAWKVGESFIQLKKDHEVNRQGLLELALNWICRKQGCSIREYMASHKNDDNAEELYRYFREIIDWADVNFKYRKEMKGIPWNELYDAHKDEHLPVEEIEKEITILMSDSDVKNKKGIYFYIFDRDEKHLSIRAFSDSDKRTVYTRQQGICPDCKCHFDISEMEAHHDKPWSIGGHTEIDNCVCLCRDCHKKRHKG